MIHRLKLLLILCLFCADCFAQTAPTTSCGQAAVMQHFYATHPEYKTINSQIEKILAAHNRALQSGLVETQRTAGIITLPVVVHIIHNNGAENITDAQVLQGIQHLNEAYANSGYYDPADGVNTQIQFCMAQRDPSNNASNGITRDLSSYTVMGGADYYSDDQNIKNINRWNPLCYINIWLVKSIPTSVVGYAYLPSAHGSNVDGIIIEAAYFGSTYANDVVIAHEMGHYLGLYHTFEGGCSNNDCSSDGDKVCDTPPDQSTAGISCTSSTNSCTTDMLSGFASDQNDLTQDYMDYGNFNCMKVFTQGQADRMSWFIQNVRKSLLACKSCMNPCPAPVTADFISPAAPFVAGTAYTFANTSVNATSYEWYVNGVLQGSAAGFNYTFPATGNYTLKLVARSGSSLCDDAIKTISINVVCGVGAGFTKSAATAAAGNNINFTNTSTGADSYEWYVNSVLQSTTFSFVYTSPVAGDYFIQLIAKNSVAGCEQTITDTVHYTCSVHTDFTPSGTAVLINTPVEFISTGTGATVYQWFIDGIAAGTGSTLTYNFTTAGAYTLQLVSGNGVCSAAKTALVYVSDKCGNAQYQFQKTFGAGSNSIGQDIRTTADGGSVLAERVIGTAGNISAAILKLDAAGNTQWMNLYSNNANSIFKKIRTTTDGGYIAIGNIQAAGTQGSVKTFIVKTTAAGTISWSRDINIPVAYSNEGNDIIQSADGSYYFTGTIEQPGVNGSTDVMVAKMDGLGTLQWITGYDARSSETANGLAEDNSHLIICGNKAGQAANAGFLLQLNKADGSRVWAKTYQSVNENFLDVQVLPDGYFVNALRQFSIGGNYTDHVYIKTDFTGKLSYAKYIQPFGTGKETGWVAATIKPNGNIISQTSGAFGGTYYDFLIQEINPATGTLWTKKYNKPDTWTTALTVGADANIWVTGLSLQPTGPAIQTYVMKLDSLGNSGTCTSTDAVADLLTAVYNTGAADFTAKAIQAQINSSHIATPVDPIANTICQYVKCDSLTPPVDTCPSCIDLHLVDPGSLCSLQDSLVLKFVRDTTCPFPLEWTADTSIVQILPVDKATLHIRFKKTGTVKLYAEISSVCGLVRDSLLLHAFNSPHHIDLGPDIQLCSFSTLRLNAGAGFAGYLWNDGSIDSILTAYQPGQYFVSATDDCGTQYRDTINITQGPVVPFDLGPDLQKCNTDTLTFTAPGSFLAYSWAPAYNISSINAATVSVWPATDTTYTVVAQVANGCTVTDTIRIKVDHSAPVQLGTDTSFCAGDSLVLGAPAGFAGYAWQDGSRGNSYTAFQQGLYWLQATAANGCISKDSVMLKNIYPSPLHFLDPEAETCDGKDLVLKAIGNWSAYHWFNNSTGSSITVNAPGDYWLQVTSADGCTARDTIAVSAAKNCISGIWFPNAFTPDNNGRNDIYKPVLSGVPENFILRIYNRFGEKVFETNDFKKGWDGLYKNKRQPPGAFVWYCNYRFTGTLSKIEKGTLVLIR